MKPYTLRCLLAVAGLTIAFTFPAGAARILYLDAAAPGASPTTQWDDLSGSGYHFANDASPTNQAVYNAANLSYDFNVASRMVGTGDESLFDFDTPFGNSPSGDPFTIMAYVQQIFSSEQSMLIVSKTTEPGNGQFLGWTFGGNGDFATRFDFNMQPSNNVERLYVRTESGQSGPPPMLLTLTHNGLGVPSLGDMKWYVNGSEVPLLIMGNENNFIGSVVNDEQLVLGDEDVGSVGVANGWSGSLFFLEIYDHELTAQEVAARWHGGDVIRPGVLSNLVPSVQVIETKGAMTFDTFAGLTYLIQQLDDPAIDNWTTTSTLIGTGGVMTGFDADPPGSPGRTLRFAIE